MGKSDLYQNYDIGTSEIQKNVPRSREISESPKLPVGPAKERRWRRVLRTIAAPLCSALATLKKLESAVNCQPSHRGEALSAEAHP